MAVTAAKASSSAPPRDGAGGGSRDAAGGFGPRPGGNAAFTHRNGATQRRSLAMIRASIRRRTAHRCFSLAPTAARAAGNRVGAGAQGRPHRRVTAASARPHWDAGLAEKRGRWTPAHADRAGQTEKAGTVIIRRGTAAGVGIDLAAAEPALSQGTPDEAARPGLSTVRSP